CTLLSTSNYSPDVW
nr:immunoglobulin heavy chain junction region [Macaca mulatta]